MFSGMVAATGIVVKEKRAENGVRLEIEAGALDLKDVALGDSIMVSGVCLTVVKLSKKTFTVDVSAETLSCTQGLMLGEAVNLEKALRFSDRLGGHLVSGHVDGVGKVESFKKAGECRLLVLSAPKALQRYIAPKGSICVNGVSLTVNQVDENSLHINLIPHTLEMTTLKALRKGAVVNLEVDLLARYVERILQARDQAA